MRIKSRLLLGFTLVGAACAGALAGSVLPLARFARDGASPATAEAGLRTAASISAGAIAFSILIAFFTVQCVAKRLARLRREAEALAAGEGEPIRILGVDDVDHVAA